MRTKSKASVATMMWLAVAALSGCSSAGTSSNGGLGGSSSGSGGTTSSSGSGSGDDADDAGVSLGSSSSSGGTASGSGSGSGGTSEDGGSAAGSTDAGTHHHDGGGAGSTDSGAGSGTDSGSSNGDAGDAIQQARVQCVQIINSYRATLSPPSPALTENTAEETCVDGQAQADYKANTAHSAFGNCKEFAQDECPGWPGPPSSINTGCFKAMWAEGPPDAGQDNHWLNMSNKSYTKVACGYYQTPSGDWWTTQDFW